jgi:hypothetical protein
MKITLGLHSSNSAVTTREVNFEKFLDRFSSPARLVETMAQYQGLSKERRAAVKAGPYYLPGVIAGTARSLQAVEAIALVVLDIDPAPDDPRDEARRHIYNDPTILDLCLEGLIWAAHATTSSTPDNPRLRVVVVPEQGIPPQLYAPLVQYVASRIGVAASTESRVVAQPMYFPKLPADAPVWFYSDLTGEPLSASCITPDALQPERMSLGESHEGGSIAFLEAPDSTVTEEMVRDALAAISPDCSRDHWIRVCCAIKHQFQDDPERGFALFDGWSQGSETKYTAEATARQWEYEEANPADRRPITVGTLMTLAQSAGWTRPERTTQDESRERLLNSSPEVAALARRIYEATDPVALTSTLPAEVGCSNLNSAMRTMLLDEIRRRTVELTGRAVNRREIQQTASIARHAGERDGVLETHPWAEGWIFSKKTEEFVSVKTTDRLRIRALDAAYARHLMNDPNYFTPTGKPRVMPSWFLLNTVQVPVVDQAVYDPSQPAGTVFEEDGRVMFNMYRTVSPELEDDPEAVETFVNHAKWLLPDNYTILLDFLSYIVRNPGYRINWSILMKGPPGCGKTFFGEIMKHVLGPGNASVLPPEIFQTSWTDWAEGRQVSFLEEVRVTGQNRFQVMDRMKQFITNNTVAISRRFTDIYQIKNVTTYIMFTNHEDALAVSNDERRYCILRCSPTSAETKKRSSEGYFATLFGLCDKAGAIRKFLLERTISPTFSATGHAPDTPSREFMAYLAKSDMEVAIDEILDEHRDSPLLMRDLLSSTTLASILSVEKGLIVSNRQLSHALVQMDYRRHPRRLSLGHALQTIWTHETYCGQPVEREIRQRLDMFG